MLRTRLAQIVWLSASSVSLLGFLLFFPPSVCKIFLDLVDLSTRPKPGGDLCVSLLFCTVVANGSVKVGDLCF